MRDRRINRRQQGDLGEASAIEWLSRQGATVFAPLGHSPDVDLIAEIRGLLIRVQVKTTVCEQTTPNGHKRWSVLVATRGGNQSWTGTAKLLDRDGLDYLFVLVGDGRRWFIPANEIEGTTSLHLGGLKYSEFEIEPSGDIQEIVYGNGGGAALESSTRRLGEYPSGQRIVAVNHAAYAFAGSNPASPTIDVSAGDRTPHGQTRVSGNRQIVIPKVAFDEAGLGRGDRLRAFATGRGEVVFRRIAREQNDDGPPGGGPSCLPRTGRGASG
jgi:PD-(D/E)XK endonuclease